MRTTVTLDDSVAERLAEIARVSRQPFRNVLNDTLRKGLRDSAPPEPKFVIRPHAGHLKPGIDDQGFNELIFELEESRVTRKRPRRKP